MNKFILTPVLLGIAVLVGACSTVPKSTTLLEQTRVDYVTAQNNPKVNSYAQPEMKLAGDAMAQANTAATGDASLAQIDELAYLAKQKIALTQEVASQKSAEAEIGRSANVRDQMVLKQRTNEAEQAKFAAGQAMMVAQAAAEKTAQAQRQTQDAQARAAQLEQQLKELAAKETERGMVITLGDVLFGTDLSRLTQDGMGTAQKLANVLQQNPQRRVLIEGFTDNTGATAYNLQLSERRASAVRSALQGMGVAPERISTLGYGEAMPVSGNDTAQSRQLNRRVEIILSDANGKIVPR